MSGVVLRAAETSDEARLAGALRAYLAELAPYYDDARAAAAEALLPLYFSEPGRLALLFERGGEWIGFALVNDHSFPGAAADRTLAEFTVFPPYRGTLCARAAARALFESRPGRWRLKYADGNERAARFWKKVTAPYSPTERRLGGELRLTFDTTPYGG